jgi:rhombotail lipoprotein
MVKRISIFLCLVVFGVTTLSGCAQQIVRRSSSAPLAQIMEPVRDSRQTAQKTPLTFPATVAIVAVPGKEGRSIPDTTLRQAAEKLKQQLLASPKYIGSVAVVTEDDMGGRLSLEKIRQVYAADVAIILSHHQDQRTSQSGMAGLMDATLVGLFVVPGVEIHTSTVVDGRVIHIPSNAIIFTASGANERTYHSTTFAREGNATEESLEGILAATAQFGTALTTKLAKFDTYDLSQAVPVSILTAGSPAEGAGGKPANDYWKKVDSYKATSGGAFGLVPVLIAAAAWSAARRRS